LWIYSRKNDLKLFNLNYYMDTVNNDIEFIIKKEKLLSDSECNICLTKFVKDIDLSLDILKNKYKLSEDNISEFENKYAYHQEMDIYKCPTCNFTSCINCINNMEDKEDLSSDFIEELSDQHGMFPHDFLETHTITMLDTGRITCPICKNIDLRFRIETHGNPGYDWVCEGFPGRKIPEELLRDIKKNKEFTNNLRGKCLIKQF
tara:strand:- start:140 stop:751 length:612 start_codon:yes stop_codon:yes gene_type:complete